MSNDQDPDQTDGPVPFPPTERGADAAPPVPLATTAFPMADGCPTDKSGGPEGAANLHPPARIGRYRVIRHLGVGNFDVFLACDEQSRRDVAIKIARSEDSAGQRRLMSLADEAETLKNLNHPRIVKLYDYVPACGDCALDHGFIVLEYIEGQTLEDLFRAGLPPPRRLARIIGLIAEAVHSAHTHKAGLVHRDLRPSNILLDLGGEPHVCDFGLAVNEVEDARFFLPLLPGPRRGDGMPESLRFWKNWVEAVDGDAVQSIGLLYGPSGGGKSSFVNAGLIPCLERDLARPVYIEATPGRTESRLLAAIHQAAPKLPRDAPLPDAVALLRADIERRSAGKTLFVLDQFEQWLQACPDLSGAELVRALRQCDGRHVQALVLVRDDFWMPVTRFFQALDVPLVQGTNAAAVELFDARHARKVLEGFGQALGQVTNNAGDGKSRLFLDEAVKGLLGPDGRVIPVRLSLFTEVVRNRPWTPATLRALGGMDGIGVKFLDDCFAAAPYRRFRSAACAVLEQLLPAPTSAIRGNPRRVGDLGEASGYAESTSEFAELLRVLASDLRLIVATAPLDAVPAAPAQVASGSADSRPPEPVEQTSYQLAHDYLVRPIRQWLERDRRSTPRGRAQLRLAFVTAAWLERPGQRQLPTLGEWLGIRLYTRASEWSADQARLMRATARHFLTRGLAALVVLGVVVFAVKSIRDYERSGALFLRAINCEPRELQGLLPEVSAHRDRMRFDLERVERDPRASARTHANAVLLLHRDRPSAQRARALRARLTEAGPDEVALIRDVLAADPATAGQDLLQHTLADDSSPDAARLRVACVLAGLAPGETKTWEPAAQAVVRGLLEEDSRSIPNWLALLRPVHSVVLPLLVRVCGDVGRDPTTRTTAAAALAETLSAQRDSAALARVLTEVQPDASLIMLRALEEMSDKGSGLDHLRRVLAEAPAGPSDDRQVARQALAAVALAVIGLPEALRPALRHQADPRLRTHTIQIIATLRLAPRALHERFAWAELGGAERQAILLAWAETPADGLSPAIRGAVQRDARRSYLEDGDPGVHSAAELLLRRWNAGPLPVIPKAATARRPAHRSALGRGWEMGPNGHTLVYLRGPLEFRMGSPENEPKRFPYEPQHKCRIERSLLVATTETTVEQYRAFKPDHVPDGRCSSDPDCPAGGVTWHEAIRYCNWLSRKAGLEPFFPDDARPGAILPSGNHDGGGFRLPTEAEWEYLCRALTATCRPFGESEQYLNRHAWTWLNSQERIAPAGRLLPNEFGLFDMLGSQWEWCLDGPTGGDYYPAYPPGTKDHPALDVFHAVPANSQDWRIVRGGSFDSPPSMARSAHRDIFTATHFRYYNGFRVLRTVRPDEESRD